MNSNLVYQLVQYSWRPAPLVLFSSIRRDDRQSIATEIGAVRKRGTKIMSKNFTEDPFRVVASMTIHTHADDC